MKNKTIIALCLFLMVISMFSLIIAEINMSDPLAQQRYQKILNEFNKTEWVGVSISITSIDVKENVISSLSESEFILDKGPSTPKSIFGKVTKEGLAKLSKNYFVTSIDFIESISTQENETISIEDSHNRTESIYFWIYLIIVIIALLTIIAFIIRKNR